MRFILRKSLVCNRDLRNIHKRTKVLSRAHHHLSLGEKWVAATNCPLNRSRIELPPRKIMSLITSAKRTHFANMVRFFLLFVLKYAMIACCARAASAHICYMRRMPDFACWCWGSAENAPRAQVYALCSKR